MAPQTHGGSAEEETNEEAPPQRALAPVMAGIMGNKGQTDATRASGKALGQGWDPTTTTEEEQIGRAVQRSTAESGRDEAPAKEIKKDGGGPMEAHKERDNVLSTHANSW